MTWSDRLNRVTIFEGHMHTLPCGWDSSLWFTEPHSHQQHVQYSVHCSGSTAGWLNHAIMKMHHLSIVYNNYYDNYIFDKGEVIKSCNEMLTLMNMQTTLTIAPPPHVRKFYIPTLTFIILVSCYICTHTHTFSSIVCPHKDVCSYSLLSVHLPTARLMLWMTTHSSRTTQPTGQQALQREWKDKSLTKLAFSNTCMHGGSVMSGICNKFLANCCVPHCFAVH